MRVCVYCGSSPGIAPIYVENARTIGRGLAQRRIGLVYGGARRGTMGALADACLEAGGEVIGVIPKVLVEAEIAHTGLTRLHVVADMHERKAKMAELADAFVALPGGAGTMEEIFEAWTWAQLGLHEKRCVLQNLGGYYDGLVTQIDRMVHEGMMRADVRAMLVVTTSADETLQGTTAGARA